MIKSWEGSFVHENWCGGKIQIVSSSKLPPLLPWEQNIISVFHRLCFFLHYEGWLKSFCVQVQSKSEWWCRKFEVNNFVVFLFSGNWKLQVSTVGENRQHPPSCSHLLPLSLTQEGSRRRGCNSRGFLFLQHAEEVSCCNQTWQGEITALKMFWYHLFLLSTDFGTQTCETADTEY